MAGIKMSHLAVLVTLGLSLASSMSIEEYEALRNQYLDTEAEMTLGANLIMDDRETQVNKILMDFKVREFTEGLDSNGDYFGSARHFFHSKPLIEASNVFKIVKILPKGAALHMHDFTVGSSDYVAMNLTHWDNLYYCIGADDHLLFRFFPSQPVEPCFEMTPWGLVKDLRDNASSPGHLDDWLKSSMSMFTETPQIDYPDTDRAWYWFEKKITTISTLVNYEPAFRDFYYQTLQEFYDDNVMYIEMRGLFDSVYRLDQSLLTPLEVVQLYQDVTAEFVRNNPSFWGAKSIYAPHRFHTNAEIQAKINEAVQMKSNYPDSFAGFDLVGQEDKGFPLHYYLPELLDAASKNVKFFFHSGETDWHGTKIDENLLDALLLNTTRFAHGYALTAHPYLLQMAKEKGTAVETCPISNQVLRLVEDFRNHPATSLYREGFPIVVASDGPGIWGSTALSHDWYVAFMAIGGQRADLRFLKQLALNSIEYSAMSPTEKATAVAQWNSQWSVFLDRVLDLYGPEPAQRNAPSSVTVEESNEIPIFP